MLRKRNTKIIATLGQVLSPIKIHSLFQAGADIFRLNLVMEHTKITEEEFII